MDVIKDKIRDRYKIIDIKTSTMGWNKCSNDKNKQINYCYINIFTLYEKGSYKNIDVEYFIVKRNCMRFRFQEKSPNLFSGYL